MFCRADRLAVNVDKSVAMCFWQSQWAAQPPAGWAPQYAGEPLPVADQYVYLGVRFEGVWARDSLVKANMERACLRATAMSAAVQLDVNSWHWPTSLSGPTFLTPWWPRC